MVGGVDCVFLVKKKAKISFGYCGGKTTTTTTTTEIFHVGCVWDLLLSSVCLTDTRKRTYALSVKHACTPVAL